ncbi:EAL domain-containing protein [Niallia sp. Krafla_26]|uniref:EAL domain-containing protein n=1 Tax=Niallia sp. Krafla_26 TaxID=3064703 RepID=UPI003D174A0E
MKRRNSLVFHIWIAINSIVLTGVLTISVVYLWRETTHLEDSLRNEAITAANTLNSVIGLYILEEDYSKITPLTYSLQSEPNIAYVIVRDQFGTTINQKGETYTNQIMKIKVPLDYFQVNMGEVEIGVITTRLNQQKYSLLFDTFVTALVYSLLSFIISYIISRKLTAPIQKLIDATRKLSKGDRNVKILEEVSISEIQELSDEFNQMANTIQNHETILVNEINKATKELTEKVEILEVLTSISNSVLKDDIYSLDVIKSTLVKVKHYIESDYISFSFKKHKDTIEIFELNDRESIVTVEFRSMDVPFDFGIHQQIINKKLKIDNHLTYFEQQLFHRNLRSLLIMPIIAKNKVIGTLNMASQNACFFSIPLIPKMDVFVNQIALALDRVAANESLQKSAYHDYLTGLPNYRLFKIKAQKALKQAHKNQTLSSILFLDLDRFKMVNDTFGHETGDLLLKYIADQIQSCLKDSEVVARIGGDEFMILLPSLLVHEEAVTVAKSVLKTLENPIIKKGYKIPISASIGISFYPEDGENVDCLIKHADRAMYRVKKQGKNNFAIYSKYEDNQLENQISLENELRKAIERNEFVVHYQPKINIQNGTIAGVEALVRWQHPEKGLVFPGDFIPLSEETGHIIQIGEIVLQEACRQCVKWQEIGFPPIPVSVNLSIRQFLQPTLPEKINKIIQETGIEPGLVELEITESMSMDFNQSLPILEELKNLGIQISVDDFGTGYSSLNYLRQLPIDHVKIDRSFVQDLDKNPNNESIVATIIQMAHNLHLTVTAEGAETIEHVRYLQKNHCDAIQGYYYSKPVSASEFENNYSQIMKKAYYTSLLDKKTS